MSQIATGSLSNGFQMSPAQQDLWAESPADCRRGFRAQALFKISGDVTEEEIRAALERIVSRHEILRTVFQACRENEAMVAQHVLDAGQPIDVQTAPGTNLEEIFEEALKEEFDLENGPCARWVIGRTDSGQRWLLAMAPALCADSGAMLRLPAELREEIARGRAAGGVRTGGQAAVTQYADYSAWHEDAQSAQGAASLYWKEKPCERLEHLRLGCETVQLKAGQEAERTGHFSLRVFSATVSGADLRALEVLACERTTDLSNLLLAAWMACVGRLAGQTEVMVAAEEAGRRAPELASAFGLYDREAPVDCAIADEKPFTALLEQVGRRRTENQRHLEQLNLRALFPHPNGDGRKEGLERKCSLPARFAYLDLRAAGSGETSATGTNQAASQAEPWIEPARVYCCQGKFKLKLVCERAIEQLRLTLYFDAASCDEELARLILPRLKAGLERIVANPAAPVGELEFLPEEERKILLSDFCVQPNHRSISLSSGASPSSAGTELDPLAWDWPVEWLSEHGAENALVCGAKKVTWRELAERSQAVGGQLRGLGAGAHTPVGLCFNRSVEAIMAMVACARAGIPYVPIDPGYPEERIRFMIEDAEVAFILTNQSELAAKVNRRVIPFEALANPHSDLRSEGEGRENGRHHPGQVGNSASPLAEPATRGADPAYIIYTSGSTGRPKGVVITRDNLAASTKARLAYYAGAVGKYLMVSSFSFDSSVAGIFWTLSQGGALVLPKDGEHQDPAALARLIEEEEITHLLCLPSLYDVILDQKRKLSSLTTVIVAGEACPAELIGRHRRILPLAGLFNEYGPTEGTVWATVYQCNEHESATPVPIGRPIPGAEVYILDGSFNPVPIGVAGELFIGGPGVAQGYLKRPELTAEKFIAHPFRDKRGQRLYRTGDLGRFRGNGQIDFLGRTDQQVKIRGHRVELGEIEALLQSHPATRECAVILREDAPGDQRLVAYLSLRPGARATPEELASRLKELPEPIRPAHIVLLSALPATPNGKIDRKALPAPELTSTRSYAEPQTEIQKSVAAIWTEVLKVKQVGLEDNFFELGGHSLLAIQVISRIRDACQVDLPMSSLFQTRTLAELATVVDANKRKTATGPQLVRRVRAKTPLAGLSASDRNHARLVESMASTDGA